jgi:hypothetical protein
LSHERVNFMARPRTLPPPLAGEGWGGGTRRFLLTWSQRLSS